MRSHARNHAARSWWLLAVALLLASVALTPVLAEEPPQKQENTDKADDDEPKVYTTEDLEQKYGTSKSKRAKPAATDKDADAEQAAENTGSTAWRGTESGEQALKSVQDEVARERTRQQQLTKAQSTVDELELQVRRLEDRILRIKNPLLKPPQADMNAEEVAEWEGLSNPQRLEQTQGQLDQARGELQTAQAEVVRLNKR